jgi:hypothetical protein
MNTLGSKTIKYREQKTFWERDMAIQDSLIIRELLYKISLFMQQFPMILYIYSKTCPRRNLNKAETCSMWKNSVVPARRIGITVLFFFLYNAESAHRGNGKQYLKNLGKITCIRRKVFWHLYWLYCFIWELMLVSFRYVLIHKALLYQERVVNDISYNKCTQ